VGGDDALHLRLAQDLAPLARPPLAEKPFGEFAALGEAMRLLALAQLLEAAPLNRAQQPLGGFRPRNVATPAKVFSGSSIMSS
jgi:hypothetical protein